MQEMQARTGLANARSQADIALGLERASRIAENKALAYERMAEANKDDETALLNKVKAIKELEDMDIGQLEKLVNLTNLLKAQESNVAQQEKPEKIPTTENTDPTQNLSALG